MKTAPDKILLPMAVVALIALPGFAFAQEACTTYVVQEGDTLGTIAQTAYGSYDYQMIFNANRDKLATGFKSLTAGLELVLPCQDGRLTANSEFNAVVAQEDEKQAEVRKSAANYDPPIKYVTGNGWKPFTDESLTGGGVLVRLATTALQRGGNNHDVKVAWVDDWGSHVSVLLPSKAFDFSIAWSVPDCSKIDLLSEEGASRCTEYDATLPLYEVADTLWMLQDSPYATVTKYDQLAGAKICKPADWSTFPLEQVGLVEPVVTHVRPATPLDCAKMVLSGEVDILAIELESATDAFTELDALNKVTSNPTLIGFLTFHLITSKKNPRGKTYIAMINQGLTEMRESGEWYDIVSAGLDEYNKSQN
jgi:hypothetical protein